MNKETGTGSSMLKRLGYVTPKDIGAREGSVSLPCRREDVLMRLLLLSFSHSAAMHNGRGLHCHVREKKEVKMNPTEGF